MADHTIIAAGQFTVTLTHPLINGGTPTTIGGFKLEGQMVQDQQMMDNSKVIALANGNSITITNNNLSGSLTFNVTNTNADGDTYYACTVKSCPNRIIQGNDAPDYQVVWNYGEYKPDNAE